MVTKRTKTTQQMKAEQIEGLIESVKAELGHASEAVDALETALKAAEAVAKTIPKPAPKG